MEIRISDTKGINWNNFQTHEIDSDNNKRIVFQGVGVTAEIIYDTSEKAIEMHAKLETAITSNNTFVDLTK